MIWGSEAKKTVVLKQNKMSVDIFLHFCLFWIFVLLHSKPKILLWSGVTVSTTQI